MAAPSSSPGRRGPRVVDAHRPPIVLGGWPLWVWGLFAVALVAETAVTVLYTVVISLQATACDEPLRPGDIASAQRHLLLVAAIAAFPWLLAAIPIRKRGRVLFAALVCVTPVVYGWSVGHWDPQSVYHGCPVGF